MKKYETLPPTVSRKETAALTGIGLRTICKLVSSGEIKSTKIGAARRIHTRALLDKYELDPEFALNTINACA